jgi:hypothetical protein
VPSAEAMVLPGYPGQTPAIAGIVADNVRAVEVITNGRSWAVPIINNSFYSDLEGVTSEDAVEIHVQYADGSTRNITVRPGTGA